MPPVMIYSVTGIEHLVYCIWSVRSLLRLGYDTIEVITGTQDERDFIRGHLGSIPCEAIDVDMAGYGMWAFRPFVLKRYKIKHKDSDVVVCDTDILWKKDPLAFFERFKDKPWVHKITSMNPADLDMDIKGVPLTRIGLRTMISYKRRYGLKGYPNFHLNCGLFMLPKDIFPKVLEDWVTKIMRVPPKEMIMTEALLSLAYSDMGLSPACDRDNIKHFGIRHDPANGVVVGFEAVDTPKGAFTGYEMAQHYYGDQRRLLYKDARAMGLDDDNLIRLAKKDVLRKRMKKLPEMPKKVIMKFRNLGKKKARTIYYVVDTKGWIQHRRYGYLKRFLTSYDLRLLTTKRFRLLWRLGGLRKRFIFFTTWRIAHGLIKDDPSIFTDEDFGFFMAAVTSHSNIGGGLDPLNPIPGRTPEEAYRLAVGLLKRFKVVNVNSMILYELLKSSLPNLLYCPNGVDTGFFTPPKDKRYDPGRIRIGWVGKVRGPKNFEAVDAALKELEALAGFKARIVKVPKDLKKIPLSFEKMRDFYRSIDFYLCASFNEGTPNPALEAGACGVPVVTTRVGNMRELIKESGNGFFIEPTAEDIIERFNGISKMTPEEYIRMSKNIRDSITRDWSWDIRMRNFLEAFARLVS